MCSKMILFLNNGFITPISSDSSLMRVDPCKMLRKFSALVQSSITQRCAYHSYVQVIVMKYFLSAINK